MTPGVVWQIHVHTGTYPAALAAEKRYIDGGVGGGDGGGGGSSGGDGAGRAGLVNRSRNARR